MHPNVARVQQALREAGVVAEVVELAASTRTAAEAAAAIGTDEARIVKSLVFIHDGGPMLTLLSGTNRASLGRLAALVGGPVRRADADTVKRCTGFPIGGVPPVAHRTPLPTYIDTDLFTHDLLWAAAGTPHTVFAVTPMDLLRLTGGEAADLREESP